MNGVFLGLQGCSAGFPSGFPSGNPSEQPCQPLENLSLSPLLLRLIQSSEKTQILQAQYSIVLVVGKSNKKKFFNMFYRLQFRPIADVLTRGDGGGSLGKFFQTTPLGFSQLVLFSGMWPDKFPLFLVAWIWSGTILAAERGCVSKILPWAWGPRSRILLAQPSSAARTIIFVLSTECWDTSLLINLVSGSNSKETSHPIECSIWPY